MATGVRRPKHAGEFPSAAPATLNLTNFIKFRETFTFSPKTTSLVDQ